MTLYEQIVKDKCEHDHHESDLLIKSSPDVDKLVMSQDKCKVAKKYFDEVGKAIWWEVPFAYDPWWPNNGHLSNEGV